MSGEAAISLSPNKSVKAIDFITKTFSTEDDNIVKKRSHKEDEKLEGHAKGANFKLNNNLKGVFALFFCVKRNL